MKKWYLFLIFAIKIMLLGIGFAYIYYGIYLISVPASYIVLGIILIFLGYPNKIKKVKDVDNR